MRTSTKNSISEVVKTRFGREKPILPHQIYSEVLGVPKKTFALYMSNKKQPRLDELERIANWLSVDAKTLY